MYEVACLIYLLVSRADRLRYYFVLSFTLMLHASPLGIPRQKKCPPHFFNIFYQKIGQIIWEHMSEVLGVGAF